jgi:hypothetical protein
LRVTVTLVGDAERTKFGVVVPLMVIVNPLDVLVEKFASPLYFAVMVCGPAESVEVENVAIPAALSVPVPSEVAPSRKDTVPVGFAVPLAGVTVAVNITLAPVFPVVGPVSEVVVEINAGAFIVSVNAAEVLVAKFVSPLYCAVIDCEPTGSIVVESVAIPPAPTTAFPASTPTPSENVTVPEIAPAVAEVTVAVSVTFAPKVAGFGEAITTVVVLAFGGPCETVTTTAVEVDVAKFASPLYVAVMECAPTASVEV